MGKITDVYHPGAGEWWMKTLKQGDSNQIWFIRNLQQSSRLEPETKGPGYTAKLFHAGEEKERMECLELTRQQSGTGAKQERDRWTEFACTVWK